eukprot:1137954-Amphidinium_carterae.1
MAFGVQLKDHLGYLLERYQFLRQEFQGSDTVSITRLTDANVFDFLLDCTLDPCFARCGMCRLPQLQGNSFQNKNGAS